VRGERQIRKEQERTKKILARFPELWALKQEWWGHDEIVVCRAPEIEFLKRGIKPSPQMKTIRVFVAEEHHGIRLCNAATTSSGNKITAINEYEIGDPDGVGLRELLSSVLTSGIYFKNKVRYVFLVEGSEYTDVSKVTVVLPPRGQTNFWKYCKKLQLLRKEAA